MQTASEQRILKNMFKFMKVQLTKFDMKLYEMFNPF